MAIRKSVLQEQREHLGAENPLLLPHLMGLAISALEAGDLALAEETMREVLALGQRVLPQPHMDTVMAEGMLARVLRDAGDLRGAEEALAGAEARMASMAAPPEGMEKAFAIQRSKICELARSLELPRCAGVPPPPPE